MNTISFHSDFPVIFVLFILKMYCLSAPMICCTDLNCTGRFGTCYCPFSTVVNVTCQCPHFWQFHLKKFHRQGVI